MCTGVDLIPCEIKMLKGEVPPMLGLTKVVVHGLQLEAHLCRLTCPRRRMAFSHPSLSIACDVRVACSAYAFRHGCYSMMTLLVLCYKLNKYLAYLAI
jgi:hypothetical protein